MTADEFRDFQHRAVHDLIELNAQCERNFRIGRWERWDYDLESATLVFSEAGTPRVLCNVQAVGTTSSRSGTWLWSWANESMPPAVTHHMVKVRQFGADHGISQLTEATLADDEHLGWAQTAITAALLGGKGAYRCPSERGGHLYFVYTVIALADAPWADAHRTKEAQQIECGQHGRAFAAYVCEHIFANPAQEWFFDEPTPANPWPDAWCSLCNRLYESEGEWTDSNSAHLKIKLMCHHCYEFMEAQRRTI